MTTSILRNALVVALASTPLFAQGFLPIGNQIMDGSQNLVTVNLGFNFTMPGGNVVTSVDVDEHGRIVEVGTDPSDTSESTAEMIAIPGGSINVCWDTVSYSAANNASVFFDTDNTGLAVITWVNVTTPTITTFQCQLNGDGSVVMCYDSRTPEDDGIIGVCPGNGAVLPAQDDLSTAIASPIIGTDPTIFEDFGFTAGVDAVDWVSTAFSYIPQGAGGSAGWVVTAVTGIADPVTPFASVEDAGSANCPVSVPGTPTSYTFAPDGLGNYDITSSASLYNATIGAATGIAADDTLQNGYDLGFTFTWPDGTAEQFAAIDPNGRVLPDSTGDFGDFSPSLAELTTNTWTSICPFWIDMNVTEPGSGEIHFTTNPGVSATITWNDVKQYDISDSIPGGLTFQLQLFADNSFIITHENIDLFNAPEIGTSADDLIVGCGTGVAPDPGEIDFTALGTVNVAIGNNYEFWDSSGIAPVEPTDLVNYLAPFYGTLASLTDPLINTTWSVQIQGTGAATFGFYLVGFTQTTLPLDPFGSPCNLLITDPQLFTTFASGSGDMTQWDLPLPNDPLLNGTPLYIQGAIDAAPQPPFAPFAGLPWAFSFTNALKGTIGQL